MRSRSQCSSSRSPSRKWTAATCSTSSPVSSATSTMSKVAYIVARPATRSASPGGTPASSSSSAGATAARRRRPPAAAAPPRRAPPRRRRRSARSPRCRAGARDGRAASAIRARPAGGPRAASRAARPRRFGCRAPRSPPTTGACRRCPERPRRRGRSRRRRAALLVQAEGERDAAAVLHVVDHLGGDDLPPQPVVADPSGEALGSGAGSSGPARGQVRVLGHVGLEQLGVQLDLAVGQRDR